MSDCVCQPAGRLTWCERHQVWKTPHWIELCSSRDDYWQAWEQGRGPGQAAPDAAAIAKLPAWLRCPHRRRGVALVIQARDFGCGCGEIALHHCEHFRELVLLRLSDRKSNQIRGRVDGYHGRQCDGCPIAPDPA